MAVLVANVVDSILGIVQNFDKMLHFVIFNYEKNIFYTVRDRMRSKPVN